ncbi:MAG: hypothetical protein ACRDP5_07890 [Streptosporangiaceae bacterium]
MAGEQATGGPSRATGRAHPWPSGHCSRADHLLHLIVDRNRPATNLMISALVTYLDANDAGTGFYAFAKELGELPCNASAELKLEFWIRQVNALYQHYSPRPQHESAGSFTR